MRGGGGCHLFGLLSVDVLHQLILCTFSLQEYRHLKRYDIKCCIYIFHAKRLRLAVLCVFSFLIEPHFPGHAF